MSIFEINAIRDRSQAWKAYMKDKSKRCPWVTDGDEMTKKTVVKQASKWWPKSERLAEAIHYLNTEAGEGIVTKPEPETPRDELGMLLKTVTDASSIPQVMAAFKAGQEKLAKDTEGYKQFRTAANDRLKELRG